MLKPDIEFCWHETIAKPNFVTDLLFENIYDSTINIRVFRDERFCTFLEDLLDVKNYMNFQSYKHALTVITHLSYRTNLNKSDFCLKSK